MIALKILLSIALVFTALGLACAVWASRLRREPELGRRRDTPAKRPYSRAELDAITARAEARRWADPLGLRRPLFFRSVRVPSAGEADGGDQVHPGFPAVRYFSLIREDRDV